MVSAVLTSSGSTAVLPAWPIAQTPAALLFPHHQPVPAVGLQIVHPVQHGRPRFPKDLRLAGVTVQLPWNKDHRAAPAAGAASAVIEGGRVGHMPGFAVLRVQNVAHPLPHKGLCIQIQQDGTGRNLSVARVAQSFPMRAVQRHAAVLIGAQAHDRRVMKPVEKIVAAKKLPQTG